MPDHPAAGLGDTDPGQTAPDPDSPLRTPDAATLPEAAVGTQAVDRVIEGHTYDGIREYDNPMPGWWVGLFWAGIVFAPVYMLGVHVFGWIDTYEEDFAERGEQLEAVRLAYASTGPAFKTDPGALAEYAGDAEMAEAGAAHFAAICAACHGAAGEGVIGPNLTDAFWIHGADPEQLWTSITVGFPTKGMPPMDGQLGEQERAEVLAYVVSLQGTDPPNAKGPEGEPAM
ncbi:cbb3-type cytochrome c oxidase N-terminal domain-containing protein [Rubrivirga sp. IMCC45206]|uniref:cbb3-type cytochrome c oxidase N-terminal domain-containing protein n=1 Tax=Rubrivirga sp. IMCC45206 TaxID=3391614 RepID=UPI00399008DB